MQHAKAGNIRFLSDKLWWLSSFKSALAFAPLCWFPATLLASANVALLLGARYLYESLRAPEMPVQELMKIFAIGCGVTLASAGAMTWALGVWLVRLTAFARACMSVESTPESTQWREGLLHVRAQKFYLVKLWAIASAYLLGPFFLMCLLTVVKLLLSPGLFSLGSGPISLQPWYVYLTDASMLSLSAVTTSYSMIILVLSAHPSAAAGETAWSAVRLVTKSATPLLLLGLFVLAVNAVVSTPNVVWSGGALTEMLSQNIYVSIAWQVWFALSSSVLWPWSVMPYCQFLKAEKVS